MFSEIFEKFAQTSPATLMVPALLERLLNAEKLDRWFEATRPTQYTRNMLSLCRGDGCAPRCTFRSGDRSNGVAVLSSPGRLIISDNE